ncbi:unnamed protein product, partial [Callosobruchus maculatus]
MPSTSATSVFELCQIATLQNKLSKAVTNPIVRPRLLERRRLRYQKVLQVVQNVLLPITLKNSLKLKPNDQIFARLQEYKLLKKQTQVAHQV